MNYKEFMEAYPDLKVGVYVVNRANNRTCPEDMTLQFGVTRSDDVFLPLHEAISDLLGVQSTQRHAGAFPQSVSPTLCGIVKMDDEYKLRQPWQKMVMTFEEIVAIVEAERRGEDGGSAMG